MVDKEQTITWIQRALDGLTRFIEAVDKRMDVLDKKFSDCRLRCDHARETCLVREDHEKRLRRMEKRQDVCETQTAINMASSWKGAKLIGACAVASAIMGVAGNLIARLF